MKWPFYSKPNRFKEIFVGYLRTNWSLTFYGVTGYINAIWYLLDFHKSYSDLKKKKYTNQYLIHLKYIFNEYNATYPKIMKSDWREVLSAYYQNRMNCRAKLEELQRVVPYHSKKYKQIILNALSPFASIAV